jgi:hypothetical protein
MVGLQSSSLGLRLRTVVEEAREREWAIFPAMSLN